MITLITGTPGSGKTLYAVTRLINEINKNPDRPIYSDIKGLKIEGVHSAPDDWREAPEGSLIIYDECQYRPEFQKQRGRTKYKQVVDLTTHRHDGKDIWFITQSPNFLHPDLLAVVGEHLHLDRPMGARLANVYKWRSAQDKPNGVTVKRRAENHSLFKYDKQIFNFYSSVDVDEDNAHHKGLKIPFLKVLPLLAGVLILLYAAYSIIFDGGLKPTEETPKTESTTQNNQAPSQNEGSILSITSTKAEENPTTPPQTLETALPPTPTQEQVLEKLEEKYLEPYTKEVANFDTVRPAIVMMSKNECRAYNQFGDKLILNQRQCKYLLKEKGNMPAKRQLPQTQMMVDNSVPTQEQIQPNPPPAQPTTIDTATNTDNSFIQHANTNPNTTIYYAGS